MACVLYNKWQHVIPRLFMLSTTLVRHSFQWHCFSVFPLVSFFSSMYNMYYVVLQLSHVYFQWTKVYFGDFFIFRFSFVNDVFKVD